MKRSLLTRAGLFVGRLLGAIVAGCVAGFAGSTPENEAYRRGERKEAAAHEWAETKRTSMQPAAFARIEVYMITHRAQGVVIADATGRPIMAIKPAQPTCPCCRVETCGGVA